MDEERRTDAPEPQERFSSRKFKFFGSYDHSIDAKGRIIVPNAYRKALGESFTITVSLDDRAVAIYPDEAFETMVDELYALNMWPNSAIPACRRTIRAACCCP